MLQKICVLRTGPQAWSPAARRGAEANCVRQALYTERKEGPRRDATACSSLATARMP